MSYTYVAHSARMPSIYLRDWLIAVILFLNYSFDEILN